MPTKQTMRYLIATLSLALAACSGEPAEPSSPSETARQQARKTKPVRARDLVHFAGPQSGAPGATARRAYRNDPEPEGMPAKTLAERNEPRVRSVLEDIVFAQSVATYHKYVDTNGDGMGEALSMRELLGVAKMRGTDKSFGANQRLLHHFEQRIENGCARHAGYYFQIWLPREGGGWMTDGMDATPGSETGWRCYAWPVDRENTGRLVFYTDESGEVLASRNRRARYDGFDKMPLAGAADGDRSDSVHDDDAFLGADGGKWRRDRVYVPPTPR